MDSREPRADGLRENGNAIVLQANNLQQSWRFDWEPPKAVLRDVRTIDWIWGG